jgi:hypothetical protein
VSYGVAHSLDAYMLATGREAATALLTLVNAVLMAPVLWFAGQRYGIQGVAAAKAAMAIVFVLTLVVAALPPWAADGESGLALRVAAAGGLQRDAGVRQGRAGRRGRPGAVDRPAAGCGARRHRRLYCRHARNLVAAGSS